MELLSNYQFILGVGGVLFIIGTGSERFSVYIKKNGKTPHYMCSERLEKIEELRKFLSVKRSELDNSVENQIILFKDSNHKLFKYFGQVAPVPESSQFPVRLVETDSPIVDIRDISTGERIGSTEYPPAVLTAHGWRMGYDNLIMSLERDAQKDIRKRIKIFNYIGYTLIILGTLIMGYAGWLSSLQ